MNLTGCDRIYCNLCKLDVITSLYIVVVVLPQFRILKRITTMAGGRKNDHKEKKEKLDREISEKELLIRIDKLKRKASEVAKLEEKYSSLKNKLDSRRSKYFL